MKMSDHHNQQLRARAGKLNLCVIGVSDPGNIQVERVR